MAAPPQLPTRLPTRAVSDTVSEVKRIDIAEFRRLGFLQEANRQFFHPHGLALEVNVEEDGTETLGGVWDYRDDPEGIIFDPVDMQMRERRDTVAAEHARHREARLRLLGGVIQPLDVQPHTHAPVVGGEGDHAD
jgi:hypothetical protein